MAAEVTIRADQSTFNRLAGALARESGGRLRESVADELGDAVDPAVHAARAALMGAAHGGMPHGGEPLRTAVAAGVADHIVLGGASAGVRVVARATGMPRGFRNAPKRLNSRRGWRHPVHGRADVWVRQIGAPGWFDDTLSRGQERYRAAVRRAIEKSVNRIERRA